MEVKKQNKTKKTAKQDSVKDSSVTLTLSNIITTVFRVCVSVTLAIV